MHQGTRKHLEVDLKLFKQPRRDVVHQAVDPGLRAAGLLLLHDGVGEEIDARLLHIKLDETPVPLVNVRDTLPRNEKTKKRNNTKTKTGKKRVSCPVPVRPMYRQTPWPFGGKCGTNEKTRNYTRPKTLLGNDAKPHPGSVGVVS